MTVFFKFIKSSSKSSQSSDKISLWLKLRVNFFLTLVLVCVIIQRDVRDKTSSSLKLRRILVEKKNNKENFVTKFLKIEKHALKCFTHILIDGTITMLIFVVVYDT